MWCNNRTLRCVFEWASLRPPQYVRQCAASGWAKEKPCSNFTTFDTFVFSGSLDGAALRVNLHKYETCKIISSTHPNGFGTALVVDICHDAICKWLRYVFCSFYHCWNANPTRISITFWKWFVLILWSFGFVKPMEPVGCVAIFRLQATLPPHVWRCMLDWFCLCGSWILSTSFSSFIFDFYVLYVPVVGWFFFYNLVLGLEFKTYFRADFSKNLVQAVETETETVFGSDSNNSFTDAS